MVLGVGAGHCFPIPVTDVEVQNQVSMGFTLHEPLKVVFFLIKRATGLGQLESFLVYFQCIMAASVG